MSYAWLARKQAEICGAHNSFFSVIRRDLKSYKTCGFSRIHFGLAVAVAVAVGFGFRIWFSILILMILCVSHSVQHNLWLRWADTKMARQAGRQGERRAERGSKPIMLTFITCNRVIFCELLSPFGNASHVPYKWLHIFKDIMLTVEIECALRHILSHTNTNTLTHSVIDIHIANKISPIFIEILTAITSWIPSRPWTHSSQREIFIIQFGLGLLLRSRNCYWLSNLHK